MAARRGAAFPLKPRAIEIFSEKMRFTKQTLPPRPESAAFPPGLLFLLDEGYYSYAF
jgi:hypothetical protein